MIQRDSCEHDFNWHGIYIETPRKSGLTYYTIKTIEILHGIRSSSLYFWEVIHSSLEPSI